MQLRYSKNAELKKVSKTKQPNGTYIETLDLISSYSIQTQEISDEVSVSMYGADIYKMLRIMSINKELEAYLKPKVNDTNDNITLYCVFIDNIKYKIKSVRENWIDIII